LRSGTNVKRKVVSKTRPTYRTLAQQIDNEDLVRELTRDGNTLRSVFSRRLVAVENSIRVAAPRIAALLPDRPDWGVEAYELLQKLVLPADQQVVDGNRVETLTLQQLRDRFRTNATVTRLYELLPRELRNVKFETIRADVESRHILRAGAPPNSGP
jgi:hypothetical protein